MDVRALPTHPGTGLTAIGLLPGGRPIWPVMGAADPAPSDGGEGADSDADAESDDDPDSDADSDETDDTWTPPTKDELEAERAAAAAKIKRANDQAKRLREQMKAAGVQTGPTKATPAKAAPAKKAAAPAPEPEVDEAPTGVDNGELERWQVRALRADAKAELIGRGCDPKMVNLALGQLNGADIDWDGDSPILDDWLDQMEDDYPALFAKQPTPTKAAPRKAGSIDQGAGTSGAPAQQQRPFGEALLRRGGWGREGSQGIAGRRR
jgi:hypothetical protein